MGISFKSGAADPVVQTLAVKAQGGDKQAQYELGRWLEDSTDPNGLKKAIKLYRIAATPRGGTRLLYMPGASGVATSVVSAGPPIEPYKAAETRLRIMGVLGESEKRYRLNSNNGDSDLDRLTVLSYDKLKKTAIPETLINDMIKLDFFSDHCLRAAKERPLAEDYLDKGWSCIIKSKLPSECSAYSDTVAKVARLSRSHPNFKILQRPALELVKRCVPIAGAVESAPPSVQPVAATVLDFLLQEVKAVNAEEVRRLMEHEESGHSHSKFSEFPGGYFPYEMCRRLFSTQIIPSPDVWILICTSDIGPDRGNILNQLLAERGYK